MKNNIEEYILLMTWRGTAQELATAAKALDDFIVNSELYLKSLCLSQSNGNDLQFRDFYRLLILDVWEHANNYDDERNKDDSPVIRVKKWLSYRMKGVIRDYWRRRTSTKLGVIGNEAFEAPFDETSYFDDVEINTDKLKIAMEKVLKPRELDILQTHFQFKGYVPKEISEALCKEYKITEGYRRNLKSQAIKKLKEFAAKKSFTNSK